MRNRGPAGDWSAFGTPSLIADDFFQAACILGTPAADCDPMALDTLTGRTLVDGAETGRGSGADVLGHPLDAVAWLARALGRHGAVADAGSLVMTGSLVGTVWLKSSPRPPGWRSRGSARPRPGWNSVAPAGNPP